VSGGTIARPPPAKPTPAAQKPKKSGLLDAMGGVPAPGKA